MVGPMGRLCPNGPAVVVHAEMPAPSSRRSQSLIGVLSMRRVFVTGASGFVGRNLVRRLAARGCEIRCLVRPTSSTRFLRKIGAELRFGTLFDSASLADAIDGCDCVFHVAGLTRALSESDLMQVNARGAWCVAQACSLQPDPPVLVLISSLAAAGPCPLGQIRSESDRPTPTSAYGHSKRAGEIAVERFAEQVPTTIVRPGIVFGPWGRDILPMFHAIARLGIHPIPTFSPPPLSLIHAEDLAELLVSAAQRGSRVTTHRSGDQQSPPSSGYYFACVPEYPTYADLGRLIARSLGRRHVFLLHLADPFPWLVAGIVELTSKLRHRADILSVDKMREAHASSWASSPEAAERDLGFHPARPLLERICETTQWYRQRRWL